MEVGDLNGWPAALLLLGDHVYCTCGIETDGTEIAAVHVVLNPEKLAGLERARSATAVP